MLDAESYWEPMRRVTTLGRCAAAAFLVFGCAILTYLFDFWVRNSPLFVGIRPEWVVHAIAVLLSVGVLGACTLAVIVLALSRPRTLNGGR
ncbi:hypothetical protein APB26_32070 [Pseudomonas aeruginosa]|nr:hypothetical protein APB26_32070 [Pseudomonas aeruginosa]RPV61291.1 hypothetical protein IPC838_18400 [Pseudomonas aeruginosa]